jgi:hypothetical protein
MPVSSRLERRAGRAVCHRISCYLYTRYAYVLSRDLGTAMVTDAETVRSGETL